MVVAYLVVVVPPEVVVVVSHQPVVDVEAQAGAAAEESHVARPVAEGRLAPAPTMLIAITVANTAPSMR